VLKWDRPKTGHSLAEPLLVGSAYWLLFNDLLNTNGMEARLHWLCQVFQKPAGRIIQRRLGHESGRRPQAGKTQRGKTPDQRVYFP
jgi:hypothetical protein